MRKTTLKYMKLMLIVCAAASLTSCDPPQVYGSVGYSSYGGGGYYGNPGMGGSVRVGGRIY